MSDRRLLIVGAVARRWPANDKDLMELMATHKWAELILNASIPS